MKSEISSKALAACAQDASKKAVQKAFALGIAVARQRGTKIVRQYPDGRTEVVGHSQKASVKPSRRRYRIG